MADGRKVRAPQGKVLANGQSERSAGKCHRKQTAVLKKAARVKRCGKSAPRPGRPGRQGKPHLEQEPIGEHSFRGKGLPARRFRVRSLRRSWATRTLDECSPLAEKREQNSAYRATPVFSPHLEQAAS